MRTLAITSITLALSCAHPNATRTAAIPPPVDAAQVTVAAPSPTPDAQNPVADAAVADAPPAPVAPRLTFVEAGGDDHAGPHPEGFPALSADGTTLVTMSGNEQSPSGASRLAVLFLDPHTGATRRQIDIMSSGEAFALLSDPPAPLTTQVRQRVATASAALEPLHLTALPFVEATAADEDQVYAGTGAGYTVRTQPPALLIVRRGGADGPVVHRQSLPAMTGAARSCRGVNYPKVRGFYPFAPNGLLVLIGYHGNDTCNEGADFWRVVTVPPAG